MDVPVARIQKYSRHRMIAIRNPLRPAIHIFSFMTISAAELNAFLETATDAARQGAAQLEAWRSRFTVKEKGRADLVTEADVASQNAVKECLLGRFPHHAFLGEEESVGKEPHEVRPVKGAPPTWVIRSPGRSSCAAFQSPSMSANHTPPPVTPRRHAAGASMPCGAGPR